MTIFLIEDLNPIKSKRLSNQTRTRRSHVRKPYLKEINPYELGCQDGKRLLSRTKEQNTAILRMENSPYQRVQQSGSQQENFT